VAVAEDVPRVALMTAAATVATGIVLTVNVAEVFPVGTVTDTGTTAPPLDEVNETTAPVLPAALEISTVPVDGAPPATELVGNEILETFCADETAAEQPTNRATVNFKPRFISRPCANRASKRAYHSFCPSWLTP